MAFGMNVSAGNFRDIVKYDARAGRLFRVDRAPSGEREQTPLPNGTPFAVDFASLEVGWVSFGVTGPVRSMVPYGRPVPPQPQEMDEKGKLVARPGFFALVYNRDLGVREWCSNAAVLMTALDAVFTSVYVGSKEASEGMIPVFAIVDAEAVTSGRGPTKSTNYAPVFEFRQWIKRDSVPDLPPQTVFVGAAGGSSAAPAPAFAAPAPAPAPASAATPSAMPF